jgi:hypothetical protein
MYLSIYKSDYIFLQANTVAHYLMRVIYSMFSRHIFESIPRCIAKKKMKSIYKNGYIFFMNEMN